MNFQPGQVVYMDYNEVPPVIHTRIVLGQVTGLEYMIQTPDGDQYVEILDNSNPDIVGFYVGPDDGSLPVGLPAGVRVYGFAPMTLQQFNAMLADGRVETLAEMGRRGIVPPVVAGPMVEIWVLAEMVAGHKIGETVQVPVGMTQEGEYGLLPMVDGEGNRRPVLVKRIRPDDLASFCDSRIALARSSESLAGDDRYAGEDVRTLCVKFGPNGERSRSYRESVLEMVQVEYDDFPLEPRTALAYARAVATVAESSFAQHLNWVAQSRIPDGDRAVHENEVLSRALDLAVCYDGLNIANLASFELLIRRKQLLAEAHSYNPAAPSYEGADHFLGTSYRPGGGIIVPELTEHVAKKLHQESLILKEKRKQAEAKGSGKKGGKKGNPGPAAPDKSAGAGGK
eukprot:Skav229111  [mRNA]  locus=scaffold92:703800:704993:+ [translate_table: standard]